MRLAKYLAHCGVASRRGSEEIIVKRKVKVNGKVITDPACGVSEKDTILYKGTTIKLETYVYYGLYKPEGVTTTLKDRHAKNTLLTYLKDVREKVVPVGRLDQNSKGLLIFTNHGELTHRLTHPKYEIVKVYEVWCEGVFPKNKLSLLVKGIKSDGDLLKAISAKVLKETDEKSLLSVELGEGKKREIRRMLDNLGYKVISLERVSIGPLTSERFKPGVLKKLTKIEVQMLKNAVGLNES
jgi:23S rRNA pseudouridine2605 synthase